MTVHANDNIKLISRNDETTIFTYFLSMLKSFIYFSLGAGFLFGAFQSIRKNSLNGFVDGFVIGIVSALIVVPIVIALDIFQKVKCYRKYKVIDFGVNQERRFLVEDEYSSAFDKMYSMLNDIKKVEIRHGDIESGIIEAVTKRSWKSFGESIKIELFKTSKSKETVIVLESKPRISLTMIDYCKNFENIEMIMEYILKGAGDRLALKN